MGICEEMIKFQNTIDIQYTQPVKCNTQPKWKKTRRVNETIGNSYILHIWKCKIEMDYLHAVPIKHTILF